MPAVIRISLAKRVGVASCGGRVDANGLLAYQPWFGMSHPSARERNRTAARAQSLAQGLRLGARIDHPRADQGSLITSDSATSAAMAQQPMSRALWARVSAPGPMQQHA